MEQLASAPPPDGSIGALLRAFRHRACLSQEQLAARADLSERTVRNLEAGPGTVAAHPHGEVAG
jgi:DNA-binding XRE family transcriptional regulator